jgi:hypothetical protein
LEVLISMFVLAVGLLSVAALIPAGRYEIAQSTQLDNTAMIGRAAFRDIAVRNYLYPGNAAGTESWRDSNGTAEWQPNGPDGNAEQPFVADGAAGARVASAQVAVAIDPLAISAGYSASFPTLADPGEPHLTRVRPFIPGVPAPPPEFWDSVFRSSVDLVTVDNRGEPFTDVNLNGQYDNGVDSFDLPTQDANGNGVHDGPNSNLPPQQSWFRDPSNPNLLTNVLRRASQGDYSWLATVVSDPTKSALNSKVTVSVAVFHKRNLSGPGAGESIATVILPPGGLGIGGGEMQLVGTASIPLRPVRPGEWLMLAGRRNDTFDPTIKYNYYRWYRVVTAARQSGNSQSVTLTGADWDLRLFGGVGTKAFLFDNIVAVYEKNLSLKIE